VTSLTSKRRIEFKRQHRRLEEQGPVRFEICAAHPMPAEVIDRMVRQKMAWCTENEKEGLFGHPQVDEYFHRLLETGGRQGQVMLAWLTCRDKPIAYNLCFRYCNVLYGYVISYDPEWRRYSPGNLLMFELIKWAVDNKLQGFDLRQGGGSYKSFFLCEKYHCAEFTFGRGLRGEIMETLFITTRNLVRTIRRREEEIVEFDILEAGAGEKKEGTDAPGP
jgi:CelD/BcsL family acetyltransferase involved in cellulose biosynthesis